MAELRHYGTPRHSGRYPWGSGERPYQRNENFVNHYKDLKRAGLTNKEIAKGMGMTVDELVARVSVSKDEMMKAKQAEAVKLKAKGYSVSAIGRRMGLNESSVRNLLDPELQEKRRVTTNIMDSLKRELESTGGYLDVGKSSNLRMGITSTKLKTAVQALKDEGYAVYGDIRIKQPGTGNYTTMKVLAPPGTTKGDILKNKDKIFYPREKYDPDTRDMEPIEQPRQLARSRVQVVYTNPDGTGGKEKDGLIQIRRGVDDISLGKARYAQVRIAVEGNMYMKGMAVYADNLPDGVDILYNSKYPKGTPDSKVFKPMKDDKFDPGNPFGAAIRTKDSELNLCQRHYTDKNGERQLSYINVVNEEGDWSDWSRTLSSQVLSKQAPALAKRQLDLTYSIKKDEFDEIMQLKEPTVKAKLLKSFAEGCDSDAVHLKAAGLPRQGHHVLIPFPEMKDNEVYAPGFQDGETVVLIRHPHGGIFEIPQLVVNNHGRSTANARKVLGTDARDAIGINVKVAEQLSGADFDGDSVIVIPNNNRDIKVSAPLKELKDFDPSALYKLPDSAPKIKSQTKQNEMGRITNLITDMTIQGADAGKIARAVKHSMVIIDSEKHHLDYKQSYKDNDIASLKKEYQSRINPETGNETTAAATVISRAKQKQVVMKRSVGDYILDPKTGKVRRLPYDPETGEKLYRETGETRVVYKRDAENKPIFTEPVRNPDGTIKRERVTQDSTQMAETKDAFALSSGTYIEAVYATHANKLKALGNEARKAYLQVERTPYSPEANKKYAAEVASVSRQLTKAELNDPIERKAIALANAIFEGMVEENPGMSKDDLKKVRNRALRTARNRLGAKRTQIIFSDREWEAVQAGAFRPTTLKKIIDKADEDEVKRRAMPRESKGMSEAKLSLARQMLNNKGYTTEEVADHLGVSVSTLMRNLDGKIR